MNDSFLKSFKMKLYNHSRIIHQIGCWLQKEKGEVLYFENCYRRESIVTSKCKLLVQSHY